MSANSSGHHIAIVGAGHAGGCAAGALRKAGHKGRITLIGSERHPPYERPPLSKELLFGAISHEKTYLQPAAYYAGAAIDLRLGTTVTAIDRTAQRLELEAGGTIPYDALLLTTGARARRLRLPGGDGRRVFYLRDIADALALRELLVEGARLAVLGAGFIGLEVAATARKRGAAVTVLELAPHPLGRVAPPEIGDFLAGVHRGKGVDLRTGIQVTAIEDLGEALRILAEGSAPIEADYAAIGIGAQPNTELAQAAGLAVQDGILVDEFGHSSDPAIFAAGDVTRHLNPLLGRHIRLEAWQNAQNQAHRRRQGDGGRERAVLRGAVVLDRSVRYQPCRWPGRPTAGTRSSGAAAPTDPGFTLFQLLEEKVVAAITVNNARDMRFARMLIRGGQKVDPAALGDKATKLQDLAR